MAYDPTDIGLVKATMNKVQSILQAGITDLNSALAADSDTANIISTTTGYPGLVTTSHVLRGMRHTAWDLPNNGPIRIHVVPGGVPSGPIFTSSRPVADPSRGAGYQYTIMVSICIFVHGRLFGGMTEEVQQDRVEAVLTTVADWVRAGVFNTITNRSLTLASTEYYSGGDKLAECSLEMANQGVFEFGYNKDEQVYGHVLSFVGKIR